MSGGLTELCSENEGRESSVDARERMHASVTDVSKRSSEQYKDACERSNRATISRTAMRARVREGGRHGKTWDKKKYDRTEVTRKSTNILK